MVKPDNKIFVYDTTKGFGRLMVNNFKNDYELTICSKHYELFAHDLKQFSVAFFIFNEDNDVVNFIAVRNKVKTIFVSSNKHEINQILKLLKNVELFDIQMPKNKMIDKIRFKLSLIFLNEDFEY